LIDTKQQATIELLSVLVQSHYDITSVTRPPLSPTPPKAKYQLQNNNNSIYIIKEDILKQTN